ncbi:aspartate aminotransferase family protein [Formosimonas limnophila]|uniref:Aspartate aminotransferase family protein n=1 Tax=Formosimonas limnophila TaxID=1384487 RepID=A0A8J3CJH2_9BURK|nr:aspartate aminotransferase family protein [Formosimonas limnophila]GHA64620.1 aspartate aminotransferase family protein [Formosimonas limnophila]
MSTNLDNLWMPFTANKQFKAAPRLLVSAKGMYYTSHDNRQILDGTAGLWCVNAGHGREQIVNAITEMANILDYAPMFQMGHPKVFEAATKLAEITPEGMNKVFFTNSGSEAVDSALKMVLTYHRANGQAQRTKFIGRERGYHGVGFGGISVGGIGGNRKHFSANLMVGVDHLPHTLSIEHAAFSRGEPEWGAHLADNLENILALHDPSTIAAVIVEPLAGSTGVLIPPKGYLKRLRELCDKHGLLLIFDEVITGFGRLGTPFAAQYFDVIPDVMTLAKGLNNAAVPMGAVVCRDEIYETVVNAAPESAIEFFHGYTYTGHPLAAAAACATLDVYRDEKLFERAASLSQHFENEIHKLRSAPHVKDIRNLGLVGGVELSSRDGAVGARAYETFLKCYEAGVLVRYTGDILAFSPPLIVSEDEITRIFATVGEALKAVA